MELYSIDINSPQCKSIAEEKQLELFSSFYAEDNHTQSLSIYDIIPKFFLSKTRAQKTNDIRKIENLKVGNSKVEVEITPAIIKTTQGNKTIFPGVREELIERALRFMAVQQNINLSLEHEIDKKIHRISIVFTLSALRKRLAKDGHNFKLSELKEGLDVLRKCDLTIIGNINKKEEGVLYGPILDISFQVRPTGNEDKDGKETYFKAFFHPLATQSIIKREYYLMNYQRLMNLNLPLARWIATRVNERFRQASKRSWMDGEKGGYRLTLKNVLNESGIVVEKLLKNNIARIRSALEELKENGFLHSIKPFDEKATLQPTKGKTKIIDMEWRLYPSSEFAEEIIKGNIERKKIGYTVPKAIQ